MNVVEKYNKLEVKHEYRATVREISVEMRGCPFLCLFGTQLNGKSAYISILSLGVCAELTTNENGIGYNADRIYHALRNADYNRKGMILGWERQLANALATEITPLLQRKNKKNSIFK